jgi:hypothetical protein
MANTPQNNTGDNGGADDWQPEDLKKGKWEGESASSATEVKPAAKQTQAAGSVMGSLFGPLWNDSRARPLFLISMFLLLGVCALACFVVSLLVVSGGGGQGLSLPGFGEPSAPQATAQPITNTVNTSVNGTPIVPAIPSRLTIGSKVFTVVTLRMDEKGEWPDYDAKDAKAAYWAGGTLVNYVIGLPTSEANQAIFNSLKPNDLIILDTGVGPLKYRVGEATTAKVDDPALLQNQSSPRVTLVLMGESGDERKLVIAPYTDEGSSNEKQAKGVPVNLGDVRVTALGTRLVQGGSVGLPPGKNYYQVDLQVTNLITRIVDASQFYAELDDGQGNKYIVSPQASAAAGAKGWAQGALQPGGSLTVTAGFEVPDALQGPTLTWVFAVDKNTPILAKVALPYKAQSTLPTPTVAAPRVAEVNLLNVNISPEGNELRVVGTLRNLTDKPLTVNLQNVELSTNGGGLLGLNQSLPGLPWNVAPGETLAFQLNFNRPPPGSSAYFSLFGEVYEIPGIP